jgi:hypothetical protein
MAEGIASLIYGTGLPPTGLSVYIYFVGQRLVVEGMAIELHIQQMTISVGGVEHDELFINWQDEQQQPWAIKPMGQAQIQQFVTTAPKGLQPLLKKWHQRKRHLNIVWGIVAAIVLSLLLLIGAVVWQYDNVVSWAASKIPVSVEEQLGQATLDKIKAEGHLIESGKAVETLSKIGNTLTQGSGYHYQWYVLKNDTVNAFAVPSGIIVVHSALLQKAENANEVAAVLAHEVQHIEQRHALKHLINSLGWAGVLTLVLGDVSAVTAVIVHQLGTSYISRELESEADKLGYAALVKANIKPDGMASFLQKLADLSGDSNADLAWISSHPNTQERVAAIKQLLKKQPCHTCQSLAIDWQAVQNTLPTVDKLK